MLALAIAAFGLNDWRFPFAYRPQTAAPSADNSPASSDSAGTEIRAINLPGKVFAFQRVDHESRQSHNLDPSLTGRGAYAYAYWEDPDSIWMDASAAAGPQAVTAVTKLASEAKARATATRVVGLSSCYWIPDSDPNTPRHGVQCFFVDEAQQLAMIVETHTADVGEISAANLANEVWRLTTTRT